ncbi:hypothetical protein CHLRE_16g657950v5 [Chlamydomonas reinhardtii]|uniref:Uncharacterized protein n=1 Tax=Chlamydomonas reinhardtii TaxID=3055 RepID=A0A2K3CTB1_CHLRE|nr:uncharacterized protein CHLRE_16g657950v5 [Chlamydomonas reinhardtii]PNW71524.1 hypothetical protein CHLRE_16g657950v5 [Chlamydomonas reinhardtii]
MEEVGPLTYIKHRVKVDVWWDRRGRVAVKEWDYHTFQPQLSVPLDPNATITTLNLPLLGALELLHAYSASMPSVRPLLDVLVGVLSGWRDADHVDGLFARRSPHELLWGYEDLLLQRLQLLLGPAFIPSTRVQLIPNDTSPEDVRAHQPSNLLDTGWRPAGYEPDAAGGDTSAAVEPGGSPALPAARDTGPDPAGRRRGAGRQPRAFVNERKIWNIEREAGWVNVSSWGPNCTEKVRGTDAFQFRPALQRNESLRVWITELYRSAVLLYKGDVELHGVKLYRFEPDPREGDPDPCRHQTIRGLANVTVPTAVGPNGNGSDANAAAHGVRLLMSLPHFCAVDPAVSAALEGVECDRSRHATFLDVEPNTGVTMRAAKRLQLSSQLSDTARAVLEPGIGAPLLLPVFWAEEASQVSEAQAAAFRGSVYRVQGWVAALRAWALPAAAVAAVLAVAAGGAAVAAGRRERRRQEEEEGRPVAGRGGGDEERGGEASADDEVSGVTAAAPGLLPGGGGGGSADSGGRSNGGGAGLSQPLLSEGQ